MGHLFKLVIALLISVVICTVYIWNLVPLKDVQALKQNGLTYDFLPENYPDLVYAIVIAEDRRFPMHDGIDTKEMYKAVYDWLFKGKELRGASTITQQLTRTLFLSQDRSFMRKFAEAILAIKLDYYLTKDEILILYLKHVMFGKEIIGFERAAPHYWKISSNELDYARALVLLTILPAPETYEQYVQCGIMSEKMRKKINKMVMGVEILKQTKTFQKAAESFTRTSVLEASEGLNPGELIDRFLTHYTPQRGLQYNRSKSYAWRTLVHAMRLTRANTCDNAQFNGEPSFRK